MISELRHKHKISLLLDASGLTRSAYYYYARWRNEPDKYSAVKEQITDIYQENHGRYSYRRITLELRNRGCVINHKAVQRLVKALGLFCRVRVKKSFLPG